MKRKMTSKRALQKLSYVPIFEDDDSNMITDTCCCVYVGDLCEVYEREVNIIKKDLDRLEKLEKVIEILKKALLLNVKEIRGLYYVLGYDTNYCMTKEEFELLKGVFEND